MDLPFPFSGPELIMTLVLSPNQFTEDRWLVLWMAWVMFYTHGWAVWRDVMTTPTTTTVFWKPSLPNLDMSDWIM